MDSAHVVVEGHGLVGGYAGDNRHDEGGFAPFSQCPIYSPNVCKPP